MTAIEQAKETISKINSRVKRDWPRYNNLGYFEREIEPSIHTHDFSVDDLKIRIRFCSPTAPGKKPSAYWTILTE